MYIMYICVYMYVYVYICIYVCVCVCVYDVRVVHFSTNYTTDISSAGIMYLTIECTKQLLL